VNFLTRFGLARSRFTIAVMLGLLIAGIASYPNFPKREDPVVVIRTAVVSAQFPGLAPERMENLVAIPIERKIRELPEVKDIRTLASEGLLIVYVDLTDEVGDVNAVWQRLRDKMNDVKIELPEGALGPFVNSDFGDVSIATMALTAEGFSFREMKDAAEAFRKKLYLLRGVAKVEFFGIQDERVWLEIDARKLASVGVLLNALIADLQRQNVILPSGTINADGTRILLETSGDFPNVRAIETMLTRVGTTDSLVRLSDLLTVRRDYVSPKVKPVYFNGRPAVVLSVVMQPDQDVTQLGRSLRAAALAYQNELPIGYAIDFATYQAEQVQTAVSSALSNVAQTFVVVGGLVIVFLGLRAGVVAAMIVPFAVLFSFLAMRALGIALEQVSIAAIIIALGLLVDNGVVIVEDITTRIATGVPAHDAALASGQQYAFPLLVSSVCGFPSPVPVVGIVRRICILSRRRRGADARGLMDRRAFDTSCVDSLVHWQDEPRPERRRVSHTRPGDLQLRVEPDAPLCAHRGPRVLCARSARPDAVQPAAETDVSAQRAQSVPGLREPARRYRHLANRNAGAGDLQMAGRSRAESRDHEPDCLYR
jgi:multidrug efflux pump subunit AcrB